MSDTGLSLQQQELDAEGQARRERFLERVRRALGRTETPHAPAPRPPAREEALRQVAADDPQRVQRWIDCAKKNGIRVDVVGAAGVVEVVETVLAEYKVRRVMLNFSTWPAVELAERIVAAGHQVLHWGQADCAKDVFECDAAVTDCRYGLADTGAVMVWSDAAFGRSTTLTVPLHVIVLEAKHILGDMIDGLTALQRDTPGGMPSNVVIINGPSKTSDIEMNLVTGVHGPKFVSVILVR